MVLSKQDGQLHSVDLVRIKNGRSNALCTQISYLCASLLPNLSLFLETKSPIMEQDLLRNSIGSPWENRAGEMDEGLEDLLCHSSKISPVLYELTPNVLLAWVGLYQTKAILAEMNRFNTPLTKAAKETRTPVLC
jgi:hypothetical protein